MSSALLELQPGRNGPKQTTFFGGKKKGRKNKGERKTSEIWGGEKKKNEGKKEEGEKKERGKKDGKRGGIQHIASGPLNYKPSRRQPRHSPVSPSQG